MNAWNAGTACSEPGSAMSCSIGEERLDQLLIGAASWAVVRVIMVLVVLESHRGPGSPLSHGGNCRHAHATYHHDHLSGWLNLHRRYPIPLPVNR
jgi:hypothetical protein